MTFSSAEASLFCRGTEENENEGARGTMGRGKKNLPYNYSFPFIVYLKCMAYFISKSLMNFSLACLSSETHNLQRVFLPPGVEGG